MKDIFNIASLARLSKAELLALKANLKAQFHKTALSPEKTNIQSNIRMIDMTLRP